MGAALGGAGVWAETIRQIRLATPTTGIEVLISDLNGRERDIRTVVEARPDILGHNVETVPRLYPQARRGSDFLRSARVLRMAKQMGGDEVITKSGLMVGLGESFDEMVPASMLMVAQEMGGVASGAFDGVDLLFRRTAGGQMIDGEGAQHIALPVENRGRPAGSPRSPRSARRSRGRARPSRARARRRRAGVAARRPTRGPSGWP